MKKILITTESLKIGGVETSLLQFVKFLSENDVQVFLKVLEYGELYNDFKKYANIEKIKVHIPKNRFIYRILKNFKFKSLLKYYSSLDNYDATIAYYGINNFSDVYALSCKCKKKYIYVHNLLEYQGNISIIKIIYKIRNIINRKKYAKFDNVICVSSSSREQFIKIYPEFKEKTIIIENLINSDIEELSVEHVTEKFSGSHNSIFVGRFIKSKGVDLLISQFEKVFLKFPDAKLYLIGDGPERERLELLVKQKELDDKIIFLGYQKNPYKYMKKMNLVVTASIKETYGLTVAEAMALGVYWISSNNSGACDIFSSINSDTRKGLVCEPFEIGREIVNYFQGNSYDLLPYNINEQIQNKILSIILKKH